jgi:hypothetical protein
MVLLPTQDQSARGRQWWDTSVCQRVDELGWSLEDLQQGKLIKIRGFPRIQKGETVPSHCVYPQDGIRRY